MSAWLILLVGALAAIGLWTWLSRRGGASPPGARARADPLGFRTPGEIEERRAALEAEDLDQLLRATNARRRARGLPERTSEQARTEYGGGPGA